MSKPRELTAQEWECAVMGAWDRLDVCARECDRLAGLAVTTNDFTVWTVKEQAYTTAMSILSEAVALVRSQG